jgi:hypothetical protein
VRGWEDEEEGMRAGKKNQEELVDCKVTWNLTLYFRCFSKRTALGLVEFTERGNGYACDMIPFFIFVFQWKAIIC